jgi:hypothetical protein
MHFMVADATKVFGRELIMETYDEVNDALSRTDSDKRQGAQAALISQVENELGVTFPVDYAEFLAVSNGAEGDVGESYVAFWRVEDLVRLNDDIRDLSPDLTLIGGDGGDTGFGLLKKGGTCIFVSVPLMDIENPELMTDRGATFAEFLADLAVHPD